MHNLALVYGRQLYRQRYNAKPSFRFLDVEVAKDTIHYMDSANEIHVLYDVSKDDQAFKIKSDTIQINNTKY